jgi:mono/diheme cytochrome c family protein
MQAISARFKSYAVVAGISLAMPGVAISVYAVKDRTQRQAVAAAMTAGDRSQAPPIFRRYGCGGCHTIPGIPGADGKVGGPLTDLRERVYIGGVATNTPDNLIRWIVSPQQFSANSAMPATGISEAEARHLAAYLYAQ